VSDYTVLLGRLRAGLVDTSSTIWGTAELDEALLQALADMSRAAGVEYTLEGLAGAVVTNLTAAHFATLVRGAVAYALLWRAAERVDAYNYQASLSADALATAAAVMHRFEESLISLASQRTAAMQTALDSPYPDGSDDTQPGWKLADDLETSGG